MKNCSHVLGKGIEEHDQVRYFGRKEVKGCGTYQCVANNHF